MGADPVSHVKARGCGGRSAEGAGPVGAELQTRSSAARCTLTFALIVLFCFYSSGT